MEYSVNVIAMGGRVYIAANIVAHSCTCNFLLHSCIARM